MTPDLFSEPASYGQYPGAGLIIKTLSGLV